MTTTTMHTTTYHVALDDDDAQAQMTLEQIRDAYAHRRIGGTTRVWRPGLAEWTDLADLAAELGIPTRSAPPLKARGAAGPSAVPIYREPRSRGIFVFLGLMFGCLGLHYFYLGYVGRGVLFFFAPLIYVLAILGTGISAATDLSVLTAAGLAMTVGLAVLHVWVWVADLITIRRDSGGVPLR